MRILVTMKTTQAQREKMARELPGEELCFSAEPAPEEIAAAHVIVGNLPYKKVLTANHLRLLQLNSAGANPYLTLERDKPGAVLCCASGAYGQAISEHMIAMLLSLIKRLPGYRDAQNARNWTDLGTVRSVSDMTILVIGMGDIGSHFGRLAHALGGRVIGVRRHGGDKPDFAEEVWDAGHIDRLLSLADVVALALPETGETVGILNEARIGRMKQGAYVINAGRGSAIDQNALLSAIRSGAIAGAGLDVTTPEPLPADDPLWQEENVLLTPHVSGQFHLPATHDRIIDIAISNILALAQGGAFVSRVDAIKGY